MVGTVGLEPTRDFSQRILSPLRLPIPPRPHVNGGSDQIRTDDHRVAVYCLTTWLRNRNLLIINKRWWGRWDLNPHGISPNGF